MKNDFNKNLGQGIGSISLFSLCLVLGAIAEPIVNGDRLFAFAEPCVRGSSLQNFLTKVTFGDDHLNRYATAANAIENKRLEIFRAAKSNPNWSNIANLANHNKLRSAIWLNNQNFCKIYVISYATIANKKFAEMGLQIKNLIKLLSSKCKTRI